MSNKNVDFDAKFVEKSAKARDQRIENRADLHGPVAKVNGPFCFGAKKLTDKMFEKISKIWRKHVRKAIIEAVKNHNLSVNNRINHDMAAIHEIRFYMVSVLWWQYNFVTIFVSVNYCDSLMLDRIVVK